MPNPLSLAPKASSLPTRRSTTCKKPHPETLAPEKPACSPSAVTSTSIHNVIALAKKLGWTHLNPDEKRLIDTLRWTNWHGRALVMEVASSLCTSHPWVDGAGQRNTASPLIRDGDDA